MAEAATAACSGELRMVWKKMRRRIIRGKGQRMMYVVNRKRGGEITATAELKRLDSKRDLVPKGFHHSLLAGKAANPFVQRRGESLISASAAPWS